MKALTLAPLRKEQCLHVLLLFLLAFVSYCILIANPGYFSHDELQRFDYFTQYGLRRYLHDMVNLDPGTSFGAPMRPFPFLIQGLQSYLLYDFPVLAHLSAVLVSATVAALAYFVAAALGLARRTALAGAIIFLFNPMSVHATGWIAALMDQWFVLWGLLGFWAAIRYVQRQRYSLLNPLVILVTASLALLSKETAVVLPALPAALALLDRAHWRNRRYWIAVITWTLPVVVYGSYRLLAIKSSFAADSNADPYAASITNIPASLAAHFVFPFLPALGELQAWLAYPRIQIAISSLLHLAVMGALWRTAGLKWLLAYAGAYCLCLLPVLFIAHQSSHYLFGSALALSMALASLLARQMPLKVRVLAGVCVAVLAIHSAKFQMTLYRDGLCMSRLATSTEALYLSNGKPALVQFTYDKKTRAHVLLRFAHDRDQVGLSYPVAMTVVAPDAAPVAGNGLLLHVDATCIAHL